METSSFGREVKIKRGRGVERSINEERIVRQKVRRSATPELETHKQREVRTTIHYDKFDDKYGEKFDKYDLKYGKYHHHHQDKYEDKYSRYDDDGGVGGKFGKYGRQFSSSHDHTEHDQTGGRPNHSRGGGGGQHFSKFEYSLRASNIHFKLPDGEVKTTLFRDFRRFGYINVKVLGFGKERHAFINFAREEDARKALHEMQEVMFHSRPLHLEWSKSTLNRFPDLADSGVSSSTGGGGGGGGGSGISKRRGRLHEDDCFEDYDREHDREHYSSRNARDVSYRNSGSAHSASRSSSHHHAPHSSHGHSHHHHAPSQQTHHSSGGGSGAGGDTKTVVPVIDPSATRTLFAGNLEQDITERELRDLFGPYGRIESVDIKLQRSTGTAYAFVKFLTINDAINAKNDMHGRQYGDLRLKIGFGRGSPSAKVWIGNLTSYADMSEVRHQLDRFGVIRRVDYANGDNHAFVHFDSLDAAQAAVTALSGFRMRSGKPIKIDLSRAAHLRAELEDFESDAHAAGGRSPYSGIAEETSGGFRRSVKNHESSKSHHYDDSGSADGGGGRGQSGSSYRTQSRGNRIVSQSPSQDERSRRGYERSGGGGRNSLRKRPHSPSEDHYDSSGYKQRGGDDELNGEVLYHRPKRSRNGLDSHHGHRRKPGDGHKDRSSYSSLEPMDVGGDRDPADRRKTSEKKAGDSSDKKKLSEADSSRSRVTSSDMIISDTALKLNDATEPVSPDSDSKSMKLDSTNPEKLADLAKAFPIAWRGSLVLKNTGFPSRMHLVGGDPAVAEMLLRSKDGKDDLSALRITQRLRLEPPRLEEVNKRMSSAGPSGHCILLALPVPIPSLASSSSSPDRSSSGGGDSSLQLRPLRSLVSYLKQKEAAGIVALSSSDGGEAVAEKDAIGVLHAFPPCEFSQNQLLKIAPYLGSEPSKEDHIVVLLVKGTV